MCNPLKSHIRCEEAEAFVASFINLFEASKCERLVKYFLADRAQVMSHMPLLWEEE